MLYVHSLRFFVIKLWCYTNFCWNSIKSVYIHYYFFSFKTIYFQDNSTIILMKKYLLLFYSLFNILFGTSQSQYFICYLFKAKQYNGSVLCHLVPKGSLAVLSAEWEDCYREVISNTEIDAAGLSVWACSTLIGLRL